MTLPSTTTTLTVTLALLVVASASARAQQAWVGGALQRDVQRFPEDEVVTRLDGSATGWMLAGGLRVWRHLALGIEWSDAGTIADVRTTTIEVNGRTVAIRSTFAHRTRALAALAGYSHGVTSRVQVAYLAGAAVTRVRREFTSTAAGLVLVPPSDRGAPAAAAVIDRFETPTGGVDVRLRISQAVQMLAGARAQRIRLAPETSGWSVRTFVGAGWSF